MKTIRHILSLSVLVLSLGSEASLKINLAVEKFKLPNGLTVLLHQDRTVPMVSYHTWYRVGSRDEKPGHTGAAHMLEHMMFKGAKKYTGKDFDRILHENGITNNAFTTWDYTGFYQNLPSGKLDLMMDMEVDRMRFLALKPEDLQSELQVVGEERRWRIDNSPESQLFEALMEKTFTIHPYRWPIIGWMEDIQKYDVQTLRSFYDRFYVPNNAVLVLAGDFDVPKTKEMILKVYGVLPFKEVPQEKFPQEPDPKGPRKVTIEREVQSTTVMFSYPIVEAGHPDSYALDLLAQVLGSGESSRLHQRLVYRDQMASSAGASSITNADPGIFVISANLKPRKAAGPADMALRMEVSKIQSSLVSVKELEKAKNQMIKATVDGMSTIDGKARLLATNEILFGSYERLFTDLEKYKSVTREDLQRVARKYLAPQRVVVGVMNPLSKGGRQ